MWFITTLHTTKHFALNIWGLLTKTEIKFPICNSSAVCMARPGRTEVGGENCISWYAWWVNCLTLVQLAFKAKALLCSAKITSSGIASHQIFSQRSCRLFLMLHVLRFHKNLSMNFSMTNFVSIYNCEKGKDFFSQKLWHSFRHMKVSNPSKKKKKWKNACKYLIWFKFVKCEVSYDGNSETKNDKKLLTNSQNHK